MRIGFLLFPGITQLDLTGPWEVLAALPDTRLDLVAKTLDPVTAAGGLVLTPTATHAEAAGLDLMIVPGGGGIDALLNDEGTLAFLRALAGGGCRMASVCTGSLLLGAAGLLRGKRAACHWTALEFLPAFGAIPVAERIVEDGDLITGGGVTAGIDMALLLAARLHGERLAQSIQLRLEYDPKPPFDAGAPGRADPDLVLAVQRAVQERRRVRAEAVRTAAARLNGA
jgi:cyclohexyl-isocyanide hydratase